MKQQKKLTLQMIIFSFLVFIAFGTIIMTEKLAPLNIEKIDKKFNNYIKENYKNIQQEINIGKTTYEKTKFKLKITNKENKNLYFYLYYQNKNIKSTYQKDYKEGNTLLRNIEQELTQNINNITNESYKITINNTLDNFSKYTKNNIIKKRKTIRI